MLFAEGVPNAAAAHLSLMMSLKGACQTIIGSRTAGLDALRLAGERIAQGRWDRAVVSAGEEFSPTVNAAYRHCGLHAGRSRLTVGQRAVCRRVRRGDADSREPRSPQQQRGARARASSKRRSGAAAAKAARSTPPPACWAISAIPQSSLAPANGTWIDRVEAAAARLLSRARGREISLSTLTAHSPRRSA